jgi:FkbM family methyltransferase
MHRKIRPRDQHLQIGCGERPGLLEFQHAESHVLSSFSREKMKTRDIQRAELVPVLRLDDLLLYLKETEVGILSVDVEGLDMEVVRGGTELLKRTRVVIIEGEEKDTAIMEFFERNQFELVEATKHNLIFSCGRREVSGK